MPHEWETPRSRRSLLRTAAGSRLALLSPGSARAASGPSRIREVLLDLNHIHKWNDSNGDTWDPFWPTTTISTPWGEALGGPTTYSDSYGDETTVVKMHSGNGEHDEMDRRAIACFDQALADAGLANNGALRQVLHDYFAWATTTTMSRYQQSADDVPSGLSIPHWSWDGLQA